MKTTFIKYGDPFTTQNNHTPTTNSNPFGSGTNLFSGISNYAKTPQGFATFASMLKPITETLGNFGGMPALMSIYGQMSNNSDWSKMMTRQQSPAPTTSPTIQPQTSQNPSSSLRPNVATTNFNTRLGCFRPPLLTTDKESLFITKVATGRNLTLDSFSGNSSAPRLPFGEAPVAEADNTPALPPTQPQTPLHPYREFVTANPTRNIAHDLGGNLLLGNAINNRLGVPVQPFNAATRLGRTGNFAAGINPLNRGNVAFNFATDAANQVGLNPLDNRFGHGILERDELIRGGEDLAQRGAGWRALQGATQPITTIRQGGELFHDAGTRLIDHLGVSDRQRHQMQQQQPEQEPSLRSEYVGMMRPHTRNPSLLYQAGHQTGVGYILDPTMAADEVYRTLASRDTLLRTEEWRRWAENRIGQLDQQLATAPQEQRNTVQQQRDELQNRLTQRQPVFGETTARNFMSGNLVTPHNLVTGNFKWPWER